MPVCTILALDFIPLQLVTDSLPLMKFDSHQQAALGSFDLAIFDSCTLWLTVLDAAVKSTVKQIAPCSGFL